MRSLEGYHLIPYIPVFKENSNTANLNFDIQFINYIGDILIYNLSPFFTHLEYSIVSEPLGILDEKFFNMILYVDQRVKFLSLREFCNDLNKRKS